MRAYMTYSTSITSTLGGVGMSTLDYRPTESSAGCTTTSSEFFLSSLLVLSSPSPPTLVSPLPSYQVDCDSREKDGLREVSNPTHQPSGETLCPHLLCAHRGTAGCAASLPGLDTPVLQRSEVHTLVLIAS